MSDYFLWQKPQEAISQINSYQTHPVFNKGWKWDSIPEIHSGKLHCKCNEKFHHGVFNRILKTYRSTSIIEISKYTFYNATRGVKMVQTPAFWVTKELGPRTNQQQIIQSFLQQHRLNTWHGYLTIKDHSRCTKA